MKSYVFITETGCDPQLGKPVKDPSFGRNPSFGACRPDLRRRLVPGDMLFVITGKVRGAHQYVLGGLEVAEKISALEAFSRFPDQRLHRDEDGHVIGNVVCDESGSQHFLDHHRDFSNRIDNYVVGKNPIHLVADRQIAAARAQTLDFLKYILGKTGETPYGIMGRASRLDQTQTEEMVRWLRTIQRIR